MLSQQPLGSTPTVFICDDDEAIRDSLSLLLKSVSIKVVSCASAFEFLQKFTGQRPACLLLDIRMPGMSGLELQNRIPPDHSDLPIIFITGHGDIETAVRAMKGGACGFLTKPFSDQELLDEVQLALHRDQQVLANRYDLEDIKRRYSHLTDREKEVLNGVAKGLSNKLIAQKLELSPKTVEMHRSNLMKRMEADSVADLLRDYFQLSQHHGMAAPEDNTMMKAG